MCFSGGVDSTVLAELAHSRGELRGVVTFNYGQAAWSQEREAVTRWVDDHPGISAHRVSFGLHGADDAMNTGAGVAGPRVVPGRNLVFLAHAVAIASSLGANEVWYGATQDDRDAYPDCRVDFAHALSSAAVRGYGGGAGS
jgi:7-cyano-7-deazaguanine synthase